jgi:hypothetical protein
MADLDHLSEEGALLAACGDAERLRSIREDCWIITRQPPTSWRC